MASNSLFKTRSGVNYFLPFVLVTLCFALWGFANDITNPMVKAFSKIFRMSVADGALVQLAFYGGYFVMALPAALFVRKFSYKSGIVMGLGLYALGALLFIPAGQIGLYYPFLIAYFIMTCGLSFLETSANPYILSMGESSQATRRLNLAQAFNPIGSLLGMFVAMEFIQSRLNPLSSSERATLTNVEFELIKNSDLNVLVRPYMFLGIVILVIFLCFILVKMPSGESSAQGVSSLNHTFGRLFHNTAYREGVVAQFFYVGAQIMCWTFIIQYGTKVFMSEGMREIDAEVLSQRYNILAMMLFCVSRFVCTFLMKYVKPNKLLSFFALAAGLLTLGVIFVGGRFGLYSLVAISVCMSLMFPTIYGLSLSGVGDDAKVGAAGLIMAILGGSVLPPLQAAIIDLEGILGLQSVNVSFILPLICFVIIAVYGIRNK
ncbi:MAG: L-fucose:H+ symporter permease [Candidatus Onthomorpha sp.]|nr:L-fucose:H+ symporter permease [Bacteroidales bacterium]MDY5699342.1 L-fucose:H+ symporter permease [Candidatus Onthomorpha sp.]